MALFQGKNGGAPFPRTSMEWMEKGYSPEIAERKVAQDVFGHDFQTDAAGKPIERGKGSALQQTDQHLQALRITEEANARRAMTMGWNPNLANAFDPRDAYIKELEAKLKAMNRRGPNKKKGRKPSVSDSPAGEA